jgi:hypothetical protein
MKGWKDNKAVWSEFEFTSCVTMSWRSGGIGHCPLDLSVDRPQPQILLYRSMSATDAAVPAVGHYQFQIQQEETVRSRPHST